MGFQNGLEYVQVKRREILKHPKAKRRQQKRLKKKKIMMRKKKRRRKRKRRNKFTFKSRPRLKSNPNNFIHSITESLLLYQRLVNVTQRVIFPCFEPNIVNLSSVIMYILSVH